MSKRLILELPHTDSSVSMLIVVGFSSFTLIYMVSLPFPCVADKRIKVVSHIMYHESFELILKESI